MEIVVYIHTKGKTIKKVLNTIKRKFSTYFCFFIHHKVLYHLDLDILLEKDIDGSLPTNLYVKRDNFNFSIVNFSILCRHIPTDSRRTTEKQV